MNGYFFQNRKIKYIECKKCTHINGFEDTKYFATKIYKDEENDIQKLLELARTRLRQKNLWPKNKFLKKFFKSINKLKVLDVGAGSDTVRLWL